MAPHKHNSVYIHVRSNYSAVSRMSTPNTLTKFINYLPVPLLCKRDKKWFIALRAITFDSSLTMSTQLFGKAPIRLSPHSANGRVNVASNLQFISGSGYIDEMTPFFISDYDRDNFKIAPKLPEGILATPTHLVNRLNLLLSIYLSRDKKSMVKFDLSNSHITLNVCECEVDIRIDLLHALGFQTSDLMKSGNISPEGMFTVEQTTSEYKKIIATHLPSTRALQSRFVQVHCDNLVSKPLASREAKRVLFQGEFSTDAVSSRIEPRHLEFLEIGVCEINSLSFKLTDQFFEQLALEHGGQPTGLEVELRQFSTKVAMQQTIHISSRDSIEEYPHNTPANFVVNLPSPLTFEPIDEWSVSLVRLHTPTTVNYFPFTKEFGAIWCRRDASVPVEATADERKAIEQHHPRHLMVKKKIYTSNVDFVNHLNNCMSLDDDEMIFKFSYNEDTGKLGIVLLDDNPVQIFVHSTLWRMFGGEVTSDKPSYYYHFIGSNDTNQLNARSIYHSLTRTRHFDFPLMLNYRMYIPHSINVYSNICQDSIVGGTYANLLKQLHFTQPTDDFSIGLVSLQSEHLDYLGLSHSRLTSIEIQLRGPTGDLIDYMDTNEAVVLSLKFYRKRKP
jgi:hypothetical protein